MSLIGSVGLTNNLNGLYLGSVNVDNIDEFAITSNALYVNDNINTIQSAINQVSQADVINISSGSFGESQILITDKLNIALTGPNTASTICEILNGFVIDGTSELIRLSNLQIKGATTQIKGVGRHRLNNMLFTGDISQTNTVEIGKNCTNFITINNTEFNNYCTISVPSSFASVLYFINCNFGGATIILSNSSPSQVVFSNCIGFQSFPLPTKATFVGLNVLTTGVSRVDSTNVNLSTINSQPYPPIDGFSSYTNQFLYGQQTIKSNTTITLLSSPSLANKLQNYPTIIDCVFNFSLSANNASLTIKYTNNNTSNIYSYTQGLTSNGHHIFPVKFLIPADTFFDYNFSITATISTGTVSTGVDDFYSVEFKQIKGNLV
jgi:hypothetical protein